MALRAFRFPCSLFLASRSYSTAPASTVVLPRLREDLKTAMRSKDTTRLSVLRSLLAEITNASKTSKPIDSDKPLYALLQKRISTCGDAAAEFASAKRPDLVAKEEDQIKVLEEYANSIETLDESEIRKIVEEVVAQQGEKALNPGMVMGLAHKTIRSRIVDSVMLKRVVEEVVPSSH